MNPQASFTVAILAACILFDQGTKWIARKYLAPDGFISYAGDLVRLQYAENTGAFLSFGSSLPEPWRYLVFTILVGAFLLGLLAFVLFTRSTPFEAIVCLAFICAGGLSNLMDRLVHDGRVTDFLNIGIGSLRTGIFNVADMVITGAATFLLIDGLRSKPEDTMRR